MDAPLYDVYLTGKLVDNTTVDQAAQRLAALFKSTPATMAGMLTGKPQLLKRGVDKNTALKYREALLNAGIEVAFKAQQQTAVAGATLASPPAAPAPSTAGLSLAPAGGDLLQPAERQPAVTANIDISALQLAPPAPLPSPAAPAVAIPDTSHLTLAAAGGDLLSAAEKQHPPLAVPANDDLSLAPPGALLETLHTAAEPIAPDISALSLAPAGTELLTPEQRNRPAPAAPNTDHIKLAN